MYLCFLWAKFNSVRKLTDVDLGFFKKMCDRYVKYAHSRLKDIILFCRTCGCVQDVAMILM